MFNLVKKGTGLGSDDTEPVWDRHPSYFIVWPAMALGTTVLTWKILPINRKWLKVLLTALIGIPSGGLVTRGIYGIIDARSGPQPL